MASTTTTSLPGYDEALARVLAHVPASGVERVQLAAAPEQVLIWQPR
jgi:hypothetical protein